MAIPFSFPVSAGDFLAYQEELAGRELTAGVRETIAAWVPIINDAYTNGVSTDTLSEMDSFIARHPADSPVALFLGKAKLWMKYAAKQRERSGKGIEPAY